MLLRLIFVIFISAFHSLSFAQKNTYHLQITPSSPSEKLDFSFQTEFSDSLKVYQEADNLLNQLKQSGYWMASYDSVLWEKNTLSIKCFQGQRFGQLTVDISTLSEEITKKAGYNFKGTVWNTEYVEYIKFRNKLVDYFCNHGYPFAKVTLDSVELFVEGSLNATLDYDIGQKVVFDTLIVQSKEGLHVRKKFFNRYLKIKQGELYDESKLKETKQLISTLPYLKLLDHPKTVFDEEHAHVLLKLKRVRSSTVDGVVGIVPQAQNTGKLMLTGQFNLDLYNPFGTGKHILFKWQQQKEASQQLQFAYEHPNIFNTGIDIYTDFSLQKEDSTFINQSQQLSFNYNTRKFGTFRFFGNWKDSRDVRDEAFRLEGNIADSRTALYGLGFNYQNLDDYFLPRKGWYWGATLAFGEKEVTDINSIDKEETLNNSSQAELFSDLKKYLMIGKKSTLFLRNQLGWIANDFLLMNDLKRLGGLSTIRGFNENAFFASAYTVNTVEWRQFFEQSSYVSLFVDGGVIQQTVLDERSTQAVFGVGAGFSFTTKTGVFNLIYALGKSDEQPIDMKYAKIHFGFVGRF